MTAAIDLASAALPDIEWDEVGPVALPPLAPPAVPLGPLRRALERALRPVFLINDLSRVMLRDLPAVLQEVWDPAAKPPVLVATGTHKGDDATRYVDLLGGFPVALHDADDAQAHLPLDDAHLDVRIDRRVGRADLVVAFGTVEPHYFAGWSGAHKTATVGVLDRATITRNHARAVEAAARPLALEGNPIFDGLARTLAVLEADRRLLAVNHVLDADGRPLGMAVGTWRGSLARCARVSSRRYVRSVPRPVDVLVARVEGPLGRSLYQADKGLKNNEDALRDGGEMILVAPLDDGVGPDRFVRLLERAPTHADALAAVAEEYVLGDHKAVRWRALEARGVRIRIVSPHLDPASVAAARLEVHPTLEAALAAVREDGRVPTGRGLVVHDAGFVVCAVEGAPLREEGAAR